MNMRTFFAAVSLTSALVLGSFAVCAAGDKEGSKPKPYPLDTCVVSGEKLGEMGKPYAFTHEGREIKLCCKSCLKDFKKAPAKFLKQIEAAEKKGK